MRRSGKVHVQNPSERQATDRALVVRGRVVMGADQRSGPHDATATLTTRRGDEGSVCRICGSPAVRAVGAVEYFSGYARTVYDCQDCRCRFTRHDTSIYDMLYESGAMPYYGEYRDLALESKRFFDQGNAHELRQLLSRTRKYHFVLEQVGRVPGDARLLEVGCSRGFLTSYFILENRNILGVDVAVEAVESARANFGDHFASADSPVIDAGAPYDVIYHVGTIGCVADPLAFTKRLVAMLKPGGKLLFNAPNRMACVVQNQLWFDSAPPPDLVTLYPPGFWRQQFAEIVDVRETIELIDADRSFALTAGERLGRTWRRPQPRGLNDEAGISAPRPRISDRAWGWFERQVGRVGRITGLSRFAPERPTEFGLFVIMTSRTPR